MSLLEVRKVSKSFGKLQAVSELDLSIDEGEVRCIIGANGAGKTTLFNLISGRTRPDSGQVVFAGEEISGMRPPQIVRKGLSRSFQVSNYFPNLSVFQNVRIAVLSRMRKSRIFYWPVSRLGPVNQRVTEILENFNLLPLAEVIADKLSHGDRRKLEISLVVAQEPRMLLLDEPTAGMNSTETESTIHLIKNLVTKLGLTLLLTEHDMKVVFSLADKITFMHYGQVVCEGPPQEIKANADVKEIYLGGEVC
ncbi:MAG: ABC transporter ATP-binding protein [Proteobacteria bacterium]|nr:ABC transporter ATP-binding protein [Pseudomonadota bacterium]MBU4275235.1 ABC transporter ATP-binding protein [Pseudomonadota bacterium]MBU4382512.1 ABC transporter ATP-binding protein [Pseudomonadota bacterium]MCG2765029.1 ABC transporter ATP-binding protein [Desulfarculaceae bacterium]